MPICEEMGSSLSKASLTFRDNKVNTGLGFLQRELNPHPEWFAFSHQALLVSLTRDSDVQLSSVEIGVDQVAAGEMVLAEGVQVPLLHLSLAHLQGWVEILEWCLHILIQTHLWTGKSQDGSST